MQHAKQIFSGSFTVTKLHKLEDEAKNYITKLGLSFNSAKTKWVPFIKNPLHDRFWHMNGENLDENDYIIHFGVILEHTMDYKELVYV